MPRGRSNTSCRNTLAAFAKTSTLRLSRPTGGSPVTNWLIRDGEGRPRPGYHALATTADEKRIIGIGYRGSPLDSTNVVVPHDRQCVLEYNGTVLTAITGTWSCQQRDPASPALPVHRNPVPPILRVNDANECHEWDGVGTNFVQTGGTTASARDISPAAASIFVSPGGDHVNGSGFTAGQLGRE